MVSIAKDQGYFTVYTSLKFDESLKDRIVGYNDKCKPILQKLPGFISQTFHISHDGTQTFSYFQWETQEDHENCMKDPSWAPLAEEWEELIGSGQVHFDMQTYQVADICKP